MTRVIPITNDNRCKNVTFLQETPPKNGWPVDYSKSLLFIETLGTIFASKRLPASKTCQTCNNLNVRLVMTKTYRYDNLTNDLPQIASKTKQTNPFRTEAEFDQWIDLQLDALEKLYVAFETKESLRGFFSR